MKIKILIVFIMCNVLISSCGEEETHPKPRGFFRIELPERTFEMFDPAGCPFKFEIPDYAIAVKDTNSLAEPCWYYLIMPKLNAQLYLTYKPLHGDVDKYLEDTHTLVYKHTARASSIDEQVIQFKPGVSGVIYSLGGDAASATQFFVTDSVNHFLRGAIYFNVLPNADSLAPVQDYLREDVLHMLKSFEWK
ncbi:MAG: gliding motility lipoprotein GldD [Bacteroidetes bacterium]|nr:gliding motility lipoprotein GldD [Bacteroidota bacterium]